MKWQVDNDLIFFTIADEEASQTHQDCEFKLVTPQSQLMQIVEHECAMSECSLGSDDRIVRRVVEDCLQCDYESKQAWMFRRKGLLQ